MEGRIREGWYRYRPTGDTVKVEKAPWWGISKTGYGQWTLAKYDHVGGRQIEPDACVVPATWAALEPIPGWWPKKRPRSPANRRILVILAIVLSATVGGTFFGFSGVVLARKGPWWAWLLLSAVGMGFTILAARLFRYYPTEER